MRPNVLRAIAGGVLGTLVMTMVGVYVAPMMGMPPMNPADMLAGQMGGSTALGWMGHLMIGVVLAIIYVTVALTRLPGPPAARGALYSLAPWLMAQIIVMPMMGMGLFSGSMVVAGGSLLGHLVYGAILGGVTGVPAGETVDSRSARRAATAVVALTLGVVASEGLSAQSHTKEPFTQARFEQLQEARALILVDVFADWCPTCAAQQEVLADFRAQHPDVALHTLTVDFDRQKEWVRHFEAPRQSTLILYRGHERIWFSVAETRSEVIIERLRTAAADD